MRTIVIEADTDSRDGINEIKRNVEMELNCCSTWFYLDTLRVYEKSDTPQTETKTETQNSNLTFENRTMLDCYNCKRYKSDDACVECRYEPKADTPQTESTGSPIGDYRDGVGAWQTDCGWGEPNEE